MASPQRHEELIRAVELHHAQYLKALRLLHEALAAVPANSTTDPNGGDGNATISGASLNVATATSAARAERGGNGGVSGGSGGDTPRSISPAAYPPVPPSPLPPSPKPRPVHTLSLGSNDGAVMQQVLGGVRRSRRLTNDLPVPSDPSPSRRSGLGLLSRGTIPASLYDNDSEHDTEDDLDFIHSLPHLPAPRSIFEMPRVASVQRLLPEESFSEEELLLHIRQLDESQASTMVALLDEVWRRRNELDVAKLFEITRDDELYPAPTYEVFDVGRDCMALARHDDRGPVGEGGLDMRTVWNTLKDVNVNTPATGGGQLAPEAAEQAQSPRDDISVGPELGPELGAVGRMTILQEPSPAVLSAVHLTMAKHFDMDELLQHLVTTQENKGKTRAYMSRAYEDTELHRRSFYFVFKYYTVLGEGLTPAPFQQFDRRSQDHKSPDHIDITECSSVLALSIGGPPVKLVEKRSRRRRVVQTGSVFDHFAPWHLLHIQSYPDDEHSLRSDDLKKHFYSGPYAFLDSLAAEYRDAVKRYTRLYEMITKLITPSNQLMFEVKLRDKLLFEDKYFTYSRRYFWAYNSLALINDGIKSMMAAYVDTFTNDFWEGRHETLWPLFPPAVAVPQQQQTGGQGQGQGQQPDPPPTSVETRNYLDKMAVLRLELKRTLEDLAGVYHKNEQLRKEIKSLREQLFSGSSVKESRRAIEQGDNIKVLTSVSMVFLPLTFVTSVFGITEFKFAPDDWRFPVTMITVCVPFFVLILILQTRKGMEMTKRLGSWVEGFFRGVDEQTRHRRELQSLAAGVGVVSHGGGGRSTSSGAAAGTGAGTGMGTGTGTERATANRRFKRRMQAELEKRVGSSRAGAGANKASPLTAPDSENRKKNGVLGAWGERWRRRLVGGGQPQAEVLKADGNV